MRIASEFRSERNEQNKYRRNRTSEATITGDVASVASKEADEAIYLAKEMTRGGNQKFGSLAANWVQVGGGRSIRGFENQVTARSLSHPSSVPPRRQIKRTVLGPIAHKLIRNIASPLIESATNILATIRVEEERNFGEKDIVTHDSISQLVVKNVTYMCALY